MPLKFLNRNGGVHTTRKLQQMSYISKFSTDISHTKGADNIVTDALTRCTTNAVTCLRGIDLKKVATAWHDDKEFWHVQEL